jgi:NAD(P)H-nitrite reductase large subunit
MLVKQLSHQGLVCLQYPGTRIKISHPCIRNPELTSSHSGSGAFGAVQKLRELGFKGSVTMVSNEGYLPIDRTKLSKALIADSSKVALRSHDFYSSADITFVQDTATAIDFDKKSVVTKSGSTYPYTKLILATGGTPRHLPLPGFKDLSNIFVLRDVQNVQDILKAVGDKGKKIVIVGSSFIGMEVANALAKENTVSIIGMEEAPLERVMGKEVGRIFQKNLEKNGAKFYMGASVDSASPSPKNENAVGAVKLKDGTELEADLVILGIGVGPATEFLRGNDSVKLEKDGSIQTDEFFKVKGMEDVYALGDIATYPYHGPGGDGAMTRIEHWSKPSSFLFLAFLSLWNSEADTQPSQTSHKTQAAP